MSEQQRGHARLALIATHLTPHPSPTTGRGVTVVGACVLDIQATPSSMDLLRGSSVPGQVPGCVAGRLHVCACVRVCVMVDGACSGYY